MAMLNNQMVNLLRPKRSKTCHIWVPNHLHTEMEQVADDFDVAVETSRTHFVHVTSSEHHGKCVTKE